MNSIAIEPIPHLSKNATAQQRLNERKKLVLSELQRLLRKLKRRIQAIQNDLKKIYESDRQLELATLLNYQTHAIARGSREAIVIDWSTSEPVEVKIALDPSKSARAQVEQMFHKAKRLKRGLPIAQARLNEAERVRDVFESLKTELETISNQDDLNIFEAQFISTGIPGIRPQFAEHSNRLSRNAKPNEIEGRKPYLEFCSENNHSLWVGRGAKDNDALTLHVAKPYHLWLHARGCTGAHVIVPLHKGHSCPSDVLIDAAHLAAHFSDARGELVVEVTYAPRRYVRKPRGSAPGAVVVDREKVLTLRIEPERITRLLATGE